MEPLRIALLTSHGAPGVARLLEDPNRGVTWELSLIAECPIEVEELAAPDYILVCGYSYTLPPSIIEHFPGRILALDEISGDDETRSSVHVVTGTSERGPVFLLGAPFPLAPMALDARERGDTAFFTAYATLHRQWMTSSSWGDLLVRTLELLAGGTIQIVGDVVWIDGAPGPCRMGHAPHVCHEPETMLARGIPRSCPFIS